MRVPCSLLLLTTLSLAPSVMVGQTYVVDKANGPGASFTSIATAIAAVPNGAVLLVRPGQYLSFVIDNKSVSVIGGPGVEIYDLSAYLQIRNLSASQHATLHGLSLVGILGPAAISGTNNQGTVLIDSCNSSQQVSLTGGRMLFDACDDVRIRNCTFWNASAAPLRGTDSRLSVAQSILLTGFWGAGTSLTNCTADFANAWLGGSALFPTASPLFLSNSEVRLLGQTTLSVTWLQAGLPPGPVVAGQGTVRVDPAARLITGGAVAFGSAINHTTVAMPVVSANTGGANALAHAQMIGPGNGVGMLLFGLPGLPIGIPGVNDPVLLLAGSESVQAAGPLTNALSASYIVPATPPLLGMRATWQGASLEAATGLQISNAVTYVHY